MTLTHFILSHLHHVIRFAGEQWTHLKPSGEQWTGEQWTNLRH